MSDEELRDFLVGKRTEPLSLRTTWADSFGVLEGRLQVQAALREIARLGLPPHPTPEKNWDSLGALRLILERCSPTDAVMDAGGEFYSVILPWLFLGGYRRLQCLNIAFKKEVRRGSIDYLPGDITRTKLGTSSLGAIACLSVIEHGVNEREFLAEARRLLRPGGLLVLSTDYWPEPVETTGLTAFGAPVHIFSKPEIGTLIAAAELHGFQPLGRFEGNPSEKPVRWEAMGLDYTFAILSFELAK